MIPELEAIKRLLLEEWDPIGIYGIPEAADEYDMYAMPLYTRLYEGAPVDTITDYLEWIVIERMGLSGNRAASHDVAERLIAIQASLLS